MPSSFLTPGLHAEEQHLASLHLRRDQSLPVILSTTATSAEHEGYAEGVVTNTRFGSFPHSTIIGNPWGSQIRASKVDTGSRGRRNDQQSKKRKADAISGAEESPLPSDQTALKEAVTASSGFIHILPPTPENWTTSLPHRTQVVYTPDYSYILHRIRARPGSVLIEAGSGSGSFTHAAARAVFDGYPEEIRVKNGQQTGVQKQGCGRVFTYEFHAERHEKVKAEMQEHGLDSIVHATHRDVYNGGFLLDSDLSGVKRSPNANAVFLDLPAPWEALQHLNRDTEYEKPSALDPSSAVHICTFSPCIEQAQKTVSYLRRYGWLEIEMVEVQQKRIDIRRDFTGLSYDGMRGVNSMAADVEEALDKLRQVEQRARDFHATHNGDVLTVKAARVLHGQQEASKVLYKEGRIVHRSEPELKTHTSYLVFAVLPRQWSEDDEAKAREKWSKTIKIKVDTPKSQRQMKKEAKYRNKSQKTNDRAVMESSTAKEGVRVDESVQLNSGIMD